MTPSPQLELHPDADGLNAFVEQALAGPERDEIVAHLAACSRCRQVIYLAQAAAEAVAPQSIPAMQAAIEPRPWLRNWRLIWVPAAALAAVALVVVFYPRHSVPAPEQAMVAPQPEQRGATPAAPEASSTPSRERAQTEIATPLARPAPRKPASQPPATEAAAAIGSPSLPQAMPDAFSFQSVKSKDNLPPLESPTGGILPQSAMAPSGPEAPLPGLPLERQRAAGAVSRNASPARASAAGFRSSGVHGQASRVVSLAAAAPPIEPQPVLTNNPAVAMAGPMIQAPPPRAFVNLRLPSGLAAVSAATAGHRTLAVDLTGALFLSEDEGMNWKPVVRQWTGRAVEVRVQPSLNASPTPAGAFELINDAGLVWVSTDGIRWKSP